MNVFIEDDAPVIVQGITGHQGMTHTARMLKANTNIVGGVNPRKAGTTLEFEDGTAVPVMVPVFATCQEAKDITGARHRLCSFPLVSPRTPLSKPSKQASEVVVVITEGIPVADSAYFVELALSKGVRIVGPNCPGLLTLPESTDTHGVNLGIIPDGIVSRGPLGLVSKSGTTHLSAHGRTLRHRFHGLSRRWR